MVLFLAKTAATAVSRTNVHIGNGVGGQTLLGALDVRNQILRQILPAIDFERCPGVSREYITRLISDEQDDKSISPADDGEDGYDAIQVPDVIEEADEALHEWNEVPPEDNPTPPVGDDVNGLAQEQTPRPRPVCSPTGAALRALFAACPPAKQNFLRLGRSFLHDQKSKTNSSPMGSNDKPTTISNTTSLPLFTTQQGAVDAYFEQVHAIFPMIDEVWFRSVFSSQSRTDDAWKALSNMVLALGSIAAGDDTSHFSYHSQVRQVIGYNTFGSGNLETLQALILLGGLYLYYVNSPNTAYLVMGTAFRMAIAMLLHRESSAAPQTQAGSSTHPPRSMSRAEIRRRTWWCLVCADSWIGILSSRPKPDRWDPLTMDTALPSTHIAPALAAAQAVPGLGPGATGPETRDWFGTSLWLSADFSKVCTKLGHRMAQGTRMTAQEVLSFDDQLQVWSKSRALRVQLGSTCPKSVRNNLGFLICQLQVARLVISQPHVLRLAEDRQAYDAFSNEDWQVVSMCHNAAHEIIDAICSKPGLDRISVWNSTFVLFQACVTLLLSIAMSQKNGKFPDDAVNDWRRSVERAMLVFKDMAPFTRPADRYGDVVQALYDGLTALNDNGQNQASYGDSEGDTSHLATLGVVPPDDTMSLDQYDMTMLEPFPNWLGYDFLFEDEVVNWYPLPDA
ncbi:hypothetical protein A1O1_07671 [Capronia coronata CBS 617.96]|uniref:Xylanolytic transcriptional activator regulatory domain-containing protein n=1 Tax=Capronia coronata CBS 617.96 TaxID=1182541 RepID=W9XX94_9EURO|nr:uncharacterized protein A1O1_07671 [Capronia coronata CBS 617.96]EXJ81606.1 hypothetical protein A1O1_07671 [Capronia coronata CBS 617.96]